MKAIRNWFRDACAQPSERYVDTCDGLRAIAVLIIGWFHIWQQSWLFPGFTLFGREISLDPLVRSGYMWVDMMLLISGFCLYLPWARIRVSGGTRPDTLDFYARRLVRIHPSYLLCLAVMLGVALVRGSYYTAAHMKLDVFSHLTYTHTFFYNSYYATNLGGSLWTLAIEMQFYLLFPLIAWLFTRRPLLTFAGMCGFTLAFRAWVTANVTDYTLYFNQLPAYLDIYAFGMAAALVHVRLCGMRHNAATRIAASVGVAAVCALLWRVVKMQAACSGTAAIQLGQMDHRILMAVLGSALLVLSAHAGWLVRHIIANPITKFISGVSFQFYIWHQTMAVWFRELRIIPSEYEHPNYSGDHPWQVAYTALCFLGAIAVSAILTYGFEKPVARALQNAWSRMRRRQKKGE